ncbi:hypothetical protein [Sulfurimonas sp.]
MKITTTLFFLIFTTFLYSAQNKENISLKSAVTFNTLCSKCHEGKCSRRLTFDRGNKFTNNHIKRYSDFKDISKNEIKEFFILLNYMKKECLLLMPDEIKYEISNLESFAISSHKGYFIPLGELKKGNYSLFIRTKDDTPFRVELISRQLDSYLDRLFRSCVKKRKFDFTIDKDTNYFLRIKSKEPLYLKVLEIKKVAL